MTLGSRLEEADKRLAELKVHEREATQPISKYKQRLLRRTAKAKIGTYGAPLRQRIKKARAFLKYRRETPGLVRKERTALIEYKQKIKSEMQRRKVIGRAYQILNYVLAGGRENLSGESSAVRGHYKKLIQKKDIKKLLRKVGIVKGEAKKRGFKSLKEYREVAARFPVGFEIKRVVQRF